jgi:acetoin utilization deacetylase AcuC-like enzyme
MEVADRLLLKAHTPDLLQRLAEARSFDMDTPAYPEIGAHARRSVGAALRALECARKGGAAMSLMRPPGHHATRDRIMGFCYLNSVAVAAIAALEAGAQRVAVFDFDVHHGNGTEDILLDRPGTAFCSIHEFPTYPGTGATHLGDNCFNYPVRPGLSRGGYRKVAEAALDDLRRFKPDVIAVSAGFDAYSGDPLGHQNLEAEDFHWFGRAFREWGVPVFGVLEGGYSEDLPTLVLAYLQGLAGSPLVALPPAAPDGAGTDTTPAWMPQF